MARVDPEGLDEGEGEGHARTNERDYDAGTRGKLAEIYADDHDLWEGGERRLDGFHVEYVTRAVVASEDHGQDVHADGESEGGREEAGGEQGEENEQVQDKGEKKNEENEEKDETSNSAHKRGVDGVQRNGDDVEERDDEGNGEKDAQTARSTHEPNKGASHEPVVSFFDKKTLE